MLLEAYGTTETSPAITVNTLEHNRPGSVGRPLEGVQVRLENYETGEPCGVGEIGKILVKGENVMKGYFDDFEQTSLSIRHGWYDTGDMGFLDADGYLWHVGRLKRFLKIAGEMVSLVKVEDVLEKLLPPDVECCVVEVPDALRGARIVAAVTRPIDEKADVEEDVGAASEHRPPQQVRRRPRDAEVRERQDRLQDAHGEGPRHCSIQVREAGMAPAAGVS